MAHERSAYTWIDAVRAFAAIAVMWQHCLHIFMGVDVRYAGGLYRLISFSASFGRDAVMVFFVISGFWISRSVGLAVAADRWRWGDYLINRLSRLWSVLLPALVIGGALDLLGRFVVAPDFYRAVMLEGEAPFDVLSRLNIVTFLGNILFLQQIAVPAWGTNGPLWTLACEAWYYIWYPVLLLVIRKPRSVATWSLLVVGFAVALSSKLATILFGCWLIGAAVQAVDARWQAKRVGSMQIDPSSDLGRWVVFAGGMACWMAGEALSRISTLNWFAGCYCVALGFGAAMLGLLRAGPAVPRGLRIFAVYGAGSSFSLYVLHLPIIIFIKNLSGERGVLPTNLRSLALVVVLSSAIILIAWLFSRVTEAKTPVVRDFARRVFTTKATIV